MKRLLPLLAVALLGGSCAAPAPVSQDTSSSGGVADSGAAADGALHDADSSLQDSAEDGEIAQEPDDTDADAQTTLDAQPADGQPGVDADSSDDAGAGVDSDGLDQDADHTVGDADDGLSDGDSSGVGDAGPDVEIDAGTGPKGCADGVSQPIYCEPEYVLPAGTDPYADFALPPYPPIEGFLGGVMDCDQPPPNPAPAEVPGPCMVLRWSPTSSCCGESKGASALGLTWYGYDCSHNVSHTQDGWVLDSAPDSFEAVTTTWNDQGQKVKEVTKKFGKHYMTLAWIYDDGGRLVSEEHIGTTQTSGHVILYQYPDTGPFPDLVMTEDWYDWKSASNPDEHMTPIGTAQWEYDTLGRKLFRRWTAAQEPTPGSWSLDYDSTTHWSYTPQPDGIP